MNRICILLFSICAACLFSCGKNNTTPQSTIVGKWSLKQQAAVMYLDNVKVTDTVFNASAITYGTAQFNNNGTFTSSSIYNPGSLSLNGPVPSSANTKGTYSYSENVLTIIPGLAGWFNFVTGSSSPPTGVSQSIKIIQLSATHLTIHSENTFTLTTGTGAHTYNQLLNFYYSK